MLLLLLLPLFSSAATFTVTNTANAGPGSLRDAIIQANAVPGNDIIVFNIPGVGPQTINIQSQLPALVDPAGVLIDGLTQPGAMMGLNPPASLGLLININGFGAGPSHGFVIQSPNNAIRGLAIGQFEQDGIRIETTMIGTTNNVIELNIIGSNHNGVTPLGNGTNQSQPWAGVNIVAANCMGTAFANLVINNVISANYAEGVSMSSCPPAADVYANDIVHNYIGTDISGTLPLGNIHDGVYMGEGTHDNLVDDNIICDNGYEGVCMIGFINPPEVFMMTYSNTVQNNSIGVDAMGMPLGNLRDGVSCGIYGPQFSLGYASNNTIANNVIANNQRNGVVGFENAWDPVNCDGNWITQNSMYNNALLGIDLDDNGLTLNDPGDPDQGANEDLNFPVISSITHCNGTVTVSGTVDVPGPTSATIELFKAAPDPSGHGEGDIFVGSASANAQGNWSTTITGVVAGDLITGTTSNFINSTSEFGANFPVPANFFLSETHLDVTCFNGSDGSIDLTVNGGTAPYTYAWSHGPTTEDVSGLSAGPYTVTVNDASGCSLQLSVTITAPSDISISFSVTDVSCVGCTDGAVDATVSGGTPSYGYSWDNGASTEDISGVAAGNYCLTVTDGNNCVKSACAMVGTPTSISENANDHLIDLFPNPNAGTFSLVLNDPELVGSELWITDVQGKTVWRSQLQRDKTEFTDLNLRGGIYFVRIEAEKRTLSTRLVIQ